MVELGSEDSPLTLHGEQLVLTPRTSDPTTTDEGDAWLRTDLAPDDNQLGTLRFDSGTETLDVPIFAIGTSDDSVSEILRVDVNGEVGYVPVRDLDERPAFEELRIETGTGTAALHDLPELRDAFFEVASVSTNSPITAGDDLVVDYQVDNTGEEEDTQDIELQDFGNTVVDTDANVTISGLSSSSGTLTWSTTDDDEGDDWIRVRTNDDSATSFVEIESAIPDSAVYLHDDWGDNKLQNRDGGATTTLNGETGFYRPEWNAVPDDSLASASSERLNISGGEGIETELNINLSETVQWEFSGLLANNLAEVDNVSLPLFAEQVSDKFTQSELNDSYMVLVTEQSGSNIFLRKVVGDSRTDIATANQSVDGQTVDITVTREPNGDWDLSIDGDTIDSGNDDSLTNPNHAAFIGRGGATATLNEVKINDGGSVNESFAFEITLSDSGGWVHQAEFDPDGTYLAGASQDEVVYVWNVGSWDMETTLTAPGPVIDAGFNPTGDRIAYAVWDDDNPDVIIRDTSDWSEIPESPLTDASIRLRYVEWSSDGSLLAFSGVGGNVWIYETSGWTLEQELSNVTSDTAEGLSFSPNDEFLSVGTGNDPTGIKIYNAGTWDLEQQLTETTSRTMRSAFSDDGEYIAYGGDTVHIHNVSDWTEISASPLTEISGGLRGLDWSDNNEYITYSAKSDTTAYVHSRGGSWPVKDTFTNDNGMYDVVFSPQTARFATAAADDNQSGAGDVDVFEVN